MKCIEFEELVENFNCDDKTLDYLRGLSFTSGGAEIEFVDLDSVDKDYPGREALIKTWEGFVTESDEEPIDKDLQQEIEPAIKSQSDHNLIEKGVIENISSRLEIIEKALNELPDKISMPSQNIEIRDFSITKDIEELQKIMDRQKALFEDLNLVAKEISKAEGDLLEKSHRIESYFTTPQRDKFIYILVLVLILLQIIMGF